jgi:hypothetical protein
MTKASLDIRNLWGKIIREAAVYNGLYSQNTKDDHGDVSHWLFREISHMTVRNDESFTVSYSFWWTDLLHQRGTWLRHGVVIMMIKTTSYTVSYDCRRQECGKEFLHVIVRHGLREFNKWLWNIAKNGPARTTAVERENLELRSLKVPCLCESSRLLFPSR